MIDFLLPAIFLGIGLALTARDAIARRRAQVVPALLRVTALFCLGTGTFLFALLVMCNP